MLATLKFDTEDVYYPPEFRIDDIPGWLAEIMTDVGVVGTFCTMGEKARTMKDRGRDDVLAAMARHDLVSHLQGNIHPLLPEVLEDKDWDDGVAAARAFEDVVCEDFRHAFGSEPVALSRHNMYWGAQHTAVGGERGICHMDTLIGVPGTEQPCWYAGTLAMPNAATPGFGGFDHIYSCDAAFNKRFAGLPAFVAACAERGVEYVNIFGCHPVQVMARGWIERYCMAGGKTRTPEQVGFRYGVRGPDDEARAKANFRRLCEFIRDHDALESVGIAEAAKAFMTQPADITRDELTAWAEEVADAGKVVLHRTFSPAELLTGIAESLVAAGADGQLPDAVDRRDVLGPKDVPTIGPEVATVTHADLLDLAAQAAGVVKESRHLPGNMTISAGRVGLGQLCVLAARAYLAQSRHEKPAALNVPQTARYPEIAGDIDRRVQYAIHEHWPYDPDMSSELIARHARLQTWTLKPAWLTPPRGPICQEARILLS